jgi:hypothetical protein
MKIFCLLFFLLAASASRAQTSLSFMEDGRVATSPDTLFRLAKVAKQSTSKHGGQTVTKTAKHPSNGASSSSKVIKADTSRLTAWSVAEMAKAKKNLVALFNETAGRLRNDKLPQQAYYRWLWGDSTVRELATQLEGLTSALPASTPGYTTGPPALSTFVALDSVLKTSFSRDSVLYRVTSTVRDGEGIILLRKKFILNDFILAYYSRVARQPANAAYDTLSRRGMEHLLAAARQRQAIVQDLLARTAAATGNGKAPALPSLDSLADSHLRIPELGLLKLLRAPWPQQWLWYTSGVLRLNPLPFTDEALLRTQPANDTTKAGYLGRYTARTLAHYQNAAKIISIDSFVQNVRFLGKEKSLFVDSAAYKQAVLRNRTVAQTFQTTGRLTNKVRLPIRRPDLSYLSFISTATDDLAKVRTLGPLTTDTRVVVSAHNLKPGHTLKLVRTQAAFIKDQSGTQKALDEGLDAIGAQLPGLLGIGAEIAKLNKQAPAGGRGPASTPEGLIPESEKSLTHENTSKINKNRNPHVFQKIYIDTSFWRETRKLVSKRLIDTLVDSLYRPILPGSYNKIQPALWAEVRSKIGFITKVLEGSERGLSEAEYISLVNDIGDQYLDLHLARYLAPALVKLASQDNLYLGTSIGLADTASLPPHKVTARLDTVALWHTERGVTGLSDSTKSYVYNLQAIPPKGSTAEPVSFASFSYKTGKRHVVQFSAGLAYSFRPVRTTELTTTDGQLSYSTTDTRLRVFAGVNIYPFKKGVFLQDKHFLGWRQGTPSALLSRVNVQLAVGIPRPLDNVYLGLGYDLGPGIRITSGVHLHGYTAYEVANNRVLTQGTTYDAVPYLAVGIDPVTFVKSLVFFK